ncbi:hypothetical protein C8R45DRAFT_829492, partial [Mycena sanguinolenta]
MAGHTSHRICTVCNLHGRDNVWNTDFASWTRRDVNFLRQSAFAWKNASTLAERNRIFEETGVRWSELWRLLYWDPTRMLVIDTMHCILEGLVHHHCRRILRVDLGIAKGKQIHVAFEYDWTPYNPSEIPEDDQLSDKELVDNHIAMIQATLSEAIVPLGSDVPGTDKEEMRNSLHKRNLRPLKFVARSLGLEIKGDENTKKRLKAPHIDALIAWVSVSNFRSCSKIEFKFHSDAPSRSWIPISIPKQSTRFIQQVIANTETPSWINSVPRNYGEDNAGTIKADEWRTLATIYLPIALVLLWGDQPTYEADRLGKMLAHSMALFQ